MYNISWLKQITTQRYTLLKIDLLHWMSRAALELIGQGGLGYSFDPLTEEVVPHPYIKAIKGLGCVYDEQ